MAEASAPEKSTGAGDSNEERVVVDASASVRGLNRLLAESRGTLRGFGAIEAVLAGVTGVVVGVVFAAFVIGVAPFSLGLRDFLWGVIAVAGAVAAGSVVVVRLWPLRHDLVIAGRLEAALRRRGLDVSDLVRSAVELRDASVDLKVGRSRALCDAHVGRAVDVVRGGGATESLGAVALDRAVPTLSALAVAIFVLGAWWIAQPASLSARLSRLFDGGVVEAALAERALQQAPIVTDLTITLRFPQYMALADEVIPGASGDITAPRGTEVTIAGRADRDVVGAALVVSGGAAKASKDDAGKAGELAVAAEVKDGRNLTARFVVDHGGAWRFRVEPKRSTFGSSSIVDPVARKIVLRDDAAPVVRLEEPEADQTVQLDDDVDLVWSAEDDVGVTEVRVVVKRQGSARAPFTLKLQDVPSSKTAHGSGSFNVADTGARAGEKLAVTIEAVDNDTISGPKVGRSTTRVLTVFSATQHHREVIARLEELLGSMVEVLGDELEAPFDVEKEPVGQRKVVERHKAIAPRVASMFKLFDETLVAIGDDNLLTDDDGVRRALANMRLDLQRADVEQKNAIERTPAPVGERAVPPALWRRVVDAQTTFVTRAEKHILYLEDLLQRERVLEAQKLVKDMKHAQQDLKELLDQYKKSGDPTTREALLDEIRRMQQQLQELAARLGELRRDVPDEYLNDESAQSEKMMEQAETLDEMIEEGRLDDAAKALENMLEQTQKMVDDLDKTGDDLGGKENRELKEKLERFTQELNSLEAGQKEELEETERAMDAARKKMEDKLKAKLQAALAEAKKKAAKAAAELQKVSKDSLSGGDAEDFDVAKARTADLQKAIEAGDVEDAIRTAEEAEAAARTAEMRIDEKQRGRFAFASKSMEKSEKALGEAADALEQARKAIEDAMPDPSQMMDGKEKERMAKQGDRQQQLGEQAQKLAQLLDEIGKDAPIFGPEHKKSLDDAKAAMERAGQQLKGQSQGRARRDGVRGARQSQSQALQQLRSLQEAMNEMGKGGSGQGGIPLPLPNGGSPGSESESNGSSGRSREDVKIPDGSDFKVKDAFRKDILDAMREGAPGDWAGEVKRYYEELIK